MARSCGQEVVVQLLLETASARGWFAVSRSLACVLEEDPGFSSPFLFALSLRILPVCATSSNEHPSPATIIVFVLSRV
jgi:hypothetical protein